MPRAADAELCAPLPPSDSGADADALRKAATHVREEATRLAAAAERAAAEARLQAEELEQTANPAATARLARARQRASLAAGRQERMARLAQINSSSSLVLTTNLGALSQLQSPGARPSAHGGKASEQLQQRHAVEAAQRARDEAAAAAAAMEAEALRLEAAAREATAEEQRKEADARARVEAEACLQEAEGLEREGNLDEALAKFRAADMYFRGSLPKLNAQIKSVKQAQEAEAKVRRLAEEKKRLEMEARQAAEAKAKRLAEEQRQKEADARARAEAEACCKEADALQRQNKLDEALLMYLAADTYFKGASFELNAKIDKVKQAQVAEEEAKRLAEEKRQKEADAKARAHAESCFKEADDLDRQNQIDEALSKYLAADMYFGGALPKLNDRIKSVQHRAKKAKLLQNQQQAVSHMKDGAELERQYRLEEAVSTYRVAERYFNQSENAPWEARTAMERCQKAIARRQQLDLPVTATDAKCDAKESQLQAEAAAAKAKRELEMLRERRKACCKTLSFMFLFLSVGTFLGFWWVRNSERRQWHHCVGDKDGVIDYFSPRAPPCKTCIDGWSGPHCQVEVPYCDWHSRTDCGHGRCLSDERDSFTCSCTAGWKGVRCETCDTPVLEGQTCQTAVLLQFKALGNGKALDSWKAGTDPCGSPGWAAVTCSGGVIVGLGAFGFPAGVVGTIVPALGDFTALTRLVLDSTNVSGTIPSSLGNLTALIELHLDSTSLSGTIPESLGRLINLTYMDLSLTSIDGTIPASLGRLTALTDLDLDHTQLSGTIPESLGRLIKLTNLDTQSTKITGCRAFCNAHSAIFVEPSDRDCSDSEHGCCCPPECNRQCYTKALLQFKASTNGKGLDSWKAGTNPCANAAPGTTWGWAWDGVSCARFQDAVVELQLVTLGKDEFHELSGTIPSSLGDLTDLMILDLDHLHLSGTIPESLGRLTALTNLDLDHTHLSGTIPESLGHLTALTDLELQDTNVTNCGTFCKAHNSTTHCECPQSGAYAISGTTDPTYSGLFIKVAQVCCGEPVYQQVGKAGYVLYLTPNSFYTGQPYWVVGAKAQAANCTAGPLGFVRNANGVCTESPDGDDCGGKWEEVGNDGKGGWQSTPKIRVVAD